MTLHKSRRRFLQGMMSAAALTPLSMAGFSRMAMAAGSPKLKVVFAVIPDGFATDSYGGYNNGLWFPTAASNDTSSFTLNAMSARLAPYHKQAVFLKGMIVGSGTGGHNAWTTILRDSNSSQTSIDILLGNTLAGQNPSARRIFSGPHATVGANWCVSWQDNTMQLPETSPYTLFNNLFSGVNNTASSSGNSVTDNSYLFNPAMDQLNEIRAVLSTREKAKLDDHLDAITTLNNDLKSTAGSGPDYSGCDPTSHNPAAGLNVTSADYRLEITRAHAEVVAGALSCGISRVATFQIGRSADQVVLKSVSTTRNPHDCAHRYGSVDEWKNSRLWYIDRVKELLDRLAAMPDPDVPGDNLLQHTLVVLTSEMADGAPEHMQDVPVTLIGGASGLLKNNNGSGRFYNVQSYGDRSHWAMGTAVDMQRVWATIAKAAGTSVPYSGNVSTLPNIFTNV